MQSQFPIVPIRDEEIRLGQFIKLANLVETGGMAKEVIAAGYVQVNGETDTRRGKVLRNGDEVAVVDPELGSAVGAVVGATGEAEGAGVGVANPADLGVDPDDDLGEYFDEATADDDFDPEVWRNL